VQEEFGRNLTYGLQNMLGRAIVVGEYADRPFPSEADIIKAHGISRSVTREAIKMLTAKGLLSARPKQGTFVRPQEAWNLFDPDVLQWLFECKMSLDLLRQFNELRLGVEPEAAALAAKRATPAQHDAIDEGLRWMVDAQRGRYDMLKADIAFHVAVLRASNNAFFVQFRDMVATALHVSIRLTNHVAGGTANIAEHAAVRDAIVAGDAALARTSMQDLIHSALVLMERANEPEPT